MWKTKTKRIIGKIKDETKNIFVVGLKSKMHLYIKKRLWETKRRTELIKTLLKICCMRNIKRNFLKREKWAMTWTECKINLIN